MAALLQLLGLPRFYTGKEWLDIPLKQPLLFCAYLACYEDWVSRDEIINLFWPEEAESKGRHNLSQLLYYCKKQVWAEGLETERMRVRWLVNSDIQQLREALASGNWTRAIELYSGQLLEKVPTGDMYNYEEWLSSERETLYQAWRDAILKEIGNLEASKQYQEATHLLNQVLHRDFLDESVLQAYMKNMALAGQRQQALKAFEVFEEQLLQELDMQPLEQTKQLAQTIRNSDLEEPSTNLVELTDKPSKPVNSLPKNDYQSVNNLPQQLTPFIGRDLELAELSDLLANPEVRLLTLLGPGGIGKTSLAIKLSLLSVKNFADDACFVGLDTLNSIELIASTIADSLGLVLSAKTTAKAQLLEFLSEKEILLILDNFEHLIEGANIVLEIFEAAPQCRILVTSRAPLGFRSEHLYELSGLNYPQNIDNLIEDYDAIKLFIRSARRVKPSFTLTTDTKASVAKICKLLQGLPLGIELAAGWLRLLSPEEIATEITSNIDLLEANHKDLPKRHQSLRAVFEHSWEMLTNKEKIALKQLAVFRGGFNKDTAKAVTNASIPSLLTLANKSLLRRTPSGRFITLMGVQQFAEEKLIEDASQQTVFQKHCEYFLALAEKAEVELTGKNQETWLKQLAIEQDNLRSALSWSITNQEAEMGLRLGGALWRFWYMRGHFAEGEKFLMQLLDLSEKTSIEIRAKVLRGAGVLSEYQNDLIKAHSFYSESLELSRKAKNKKAVARALNNLANVAYRQRNYPEARTLYEECLSTFRELAEPWQIAVTLSNLGLLSYKQSDYKSSEEFLEESLKLSRQVGNKWMVASSLNNLGNVAQAQGNYSKALTLYNDSLTIAEELEDQMGIATLLTDLGTVAHNQKEFEKAQELFNKSLKLRREIADNSGIASTLLELGRLAQDRQNYIEAHNFYSESLAILENLGDKHILTQVLEGYSTLMTLRGQAVLALRLAGAADTARKEMGAPLCAIEKIYLETYLERARANLGVKAKAEFIKGQSMSLEEALSLNGLIVKGNLNSNHE